MNTIYLINKGVNRSVEFKGLRAQYIWYLGGGLVAILVLFAVLYIMGVNSYICIAVTITAGALLFVYVYKLNNKYGQYGLMRKAVQKKIPKAVRCNDRKRLMYGKVVA